MSFPAAAIVFLPPLLEARKRQLLTAKNYFQSSTQSGFEMQLSIIDVIIPDHGIRIFTGLQRIVEIILLWIVFKSGKSLRLSLGPGELLLSVAED